MEKPIVRVPSNQVGPVFAQDGLINLISNVASANDKSSYGRYALNVLDLLDLDAAYRTTWFRKICDIIPFDEVREWREWTGGTEAQVTKLDNEEKRLDLRRKIREARILARKDGASAIIIGTGGDASKPLDLAQIGRGGLKYITVMNRYELNPGDRDMDISSPTFGRPKVYQLRDANVMAPIHPSRVVVFTGNPIRQMNFWDGWGGESIWVELRDAVKSSDQIAAGVAAMIDEAKIDIIKIEDLMNNLTTTEGTSLLTHRMTAVNLLKSIVNALVLDKNDDYDRKTLNFQGLPDLQRVALMIMAGRADIPATRLVGQSPQGMNATGESDMRNYYDRIRAGQTNDLGPTIGPIDECLIRSALGSRPAKLFYEWNPLYSMTEKEAAEVEKIMSEVVEKYANTGLVPDTALAAMAKNGLIERGQFPGAQAAYDEAEAAGDEAGILSEPTEAEIAEEEARVAVAMATAADPTGGANRVPVKDAAPRSLYIRRDVINHEEIRRWAKKQGFTDIVDDMHVTIAHSAAEVDWFKVGVSWSDKLEIAAGGPRLIERLGDDGKYIVLLIPPVWELVWRHKEVIENGGSWTWPEYQPHISIQVGGEVPDGVEPYRGKIILGPEIFEKVRP